MTDFRLGVGDRDISVLLDIRQPFAYLALAPIAELAEECGVTIDFLPIMDSPLKAPSEPGPNDDRGIRHRRNRAQAIAREIQIYSETQSLVIEGYYRNPDPMPFNIAWLSIRRFCGERLFDFLETAFRSYWTLEFDPANQDDVNRLVGSIVPDATTLGDWSQNEGAKRAEVLASELIDRGLARAPSYILQDEVFVGRQHLQMIRWILGGRVGNGPI